MPSPAARTARRIRELLEPIRPSVEDAVFAVEPTPLGSVTGLLSAVPADVCESIGGIWTDAARFVSEDELYEQFSHEDRLLLDLVLSMADDRRSFAIPAGADRVN